MGGAPGKLVKSEKSRKELGREWFEQTHSPAKKRSLQPRLCRLEVEVCGFSEKSRMVLHLGGGPASLFGQGGGQSTEGPGGWWRPKSPKASWLVPQMPKVAPATLNLRFQISKMGKLSKLCVDHTRQSSSSLPQEMPAGGKGQRAASSGDCVLESL